MIKDRNTLNKVIIFRFLIATTILVVNAAIFGLAQNAVYKLMLVLYILTILYFLFEFLKIYSIVVNYLQVFFDLIIVTFLVHYTGGVSSVSSLLYPLISIAASIIISPRASIFVALLGSSLYAGLVVLHYLKVVPIPFLPSIWFEKNSDYVFSLLYFRVTIFCIIGFLSAYIAEQVNKKDLVLMNLREKLRREDRLSAIGKLAANAAHEIRNPLASISGCVEALNDSLELDESDQRLFDLVMKETARLNNIINGLLEYVKPRKLNIEKTVIAELIDEVIALIKNSKEFKEKIQIKRENNFDNIKVLCDPNQIKQVFFNLLINAVEAIENSGKITIRGKLNKVKEMIEISVVDNGHGISKKQLKNLFEPFSSSKDSGVGLGLAIISTIIKEHGGNIEVESKVGKGTEFRIFLPLKNIIKK